MDSFEPIKSVNPWDEGDYRIHGRVVEAPDGGFWPAYSIERIRGIPDAPKQAAAFHEVRAQSFTTRGLAEMMAISHGVQRVRTLHRLDC
ncbi:hypothetical protein [Massilia oculi]|uniref:hypothetical protein n=1 Tax=Massilia oculi TaxID=945844 RepID=UPI001AAE2C7A|nr:hypothetical protein [Massilia oculi]